MFLFATPPGREAKSAQALGGTSASTPVTKAIRDGAARTGADFDYLVRTAQRESALDPNAKARTSSATGLFQFIDQTWFQMVREEGPRHGLAAYAEAIRPDGEGRLTVSDTGLRQEILDLRKDPHLASVMAGAFTQKNRDAFAAGIGRQPTQGELYVAHFLGARGAVALTQAAASTPGQSAAALFPDAAGANRPIFYDRAGKARSAAEVYGLLTNLPASPAGAQASGAESAEILAGLSPQRAKGLVGLFSTEGPRGPVSDAVTRHWATRRGDVRVAAIPEGPRFFPRLTQSDAASARELPAEAPGQEPSGPLVNAPMPPVRPVFDAPVAQLTTPLKPTMRRAPLDLTRFLSLRGGA